MRDEKRFWDRFSHIYTKFVSDSDRTYDEAAALIAPYVEPGMRVLELACGTGQFTLRLASLAGEWYATDFSAAMLGRAARRAGSRGAAFGVADAFNLALPDASFDAVLIDPPYALGPEPAEALLEALAAHSLLASGAIALFEHRSDLPGAHPQGFEIVREKRYGTTTVDVLQLVDETN